MSNPIVPIETWLQWKLTDDDTLFDWCSNDISQDHVFHEYTVLTWEEPEKHLLSKYSLNEIGEILWQSDHVYCHAGCTREFRNRAWVALSNLFKKVFEPHVSSCLGHLSESSESTDSLDGACYIWWHQSSYFPSNSCVETVDSEFFLSFCQMCLASSSPAIQESAIHGLGHAAEESHRLQGAVDLLDEYIKRNLPARGELIAYAQSAQIGHVQ